MRSKIDILAEEVLSQLEMQENHLLNWGFLDGVFDALEKVSGVISTPPTPLIAQYWSELSAEGVTAADIIKNLESRRLLFKRRQDAYRTRYAETVRLLYLLKQRFKFTDWLSAKNLVSNIKSLLTYRRYPRRDQTWNQIKEELVRETYIQPFSIQALDLLLEQGNIVLSGFQVRSLKQLVENNSAKDSGIIIGAGTGSGKTKAFYLPAFARIALSVSNDSSYWPRIVGIYPRNELLKDQYREALSELLKLNPLLQNNSSRPITIGCYFGDTPNTARDVAEHSDRKWRKKGEDYVCPFFLCPKCDSEMLWRLADYVKQEENLCCSNPQCNFRVGQENVVLTRQRMQVSPPDILFTTTEMMNRKLSSASEHRIFGIFENPPFYMLFDEVHIYEGVTGGHVSYVIRRWRNLVKRMAKKKHSIQYVGLSATLPNPEEFFAQFVGVTAAQNTYITPADSEMVEEGIEYNLVLRGDPFSAAALLSTSVQTAMLMGRMLDPLWQNVSAGAIGSKIFGFTDKLDVINRWYHIEVDAEKNLRLSRYRDRGELEREKPELFDRTLQAQRRTGQLWDVATLIDSMSLKNALTLDITSSQQKGVSSKAKLVIATSTLEVGYNDPDVGAVIQHKAPRNLASFMQRKGRAGRKRGMRPWTIVVTSAYGRDRYAYDYPEQLYSPKLPDLSLPVRNVYIQRIQAVYALLDYLSLYLGNYGFKQAIWNVLSPGINGFTRERRLVQQCLMDILEGREQEFPVFLQEALQLSEAQINRLLWTPPRSLMFDAIPSLLAHLETRWGKDLTNFKQPYELGNAPMQGYIPSNLFSSLDVHELCIRTPYSEKPNYQALQQAIREFAPGNVTKRYVNVHRLAEAHWLNPGDSGVLELQGGKITANPLQLVSSEEGEVLVLQPIAYEVEQIPKGLSDRTTGMLHWELDLQTVGGIEDKVNGVKIPLLSYSVLHDFFKEIVMYTMNENEFVRITRYAPHVKMERKTSKGESERQEVVFQYNCKPAALGFQVEVDALKFSLKDVSFTNIREHENWPELLQELRPSFYLYELQQEQTLSSQLSVFEIEWLWQICLSSVIAIAVSRQVDLMQAIEEYRDKFTAISERTLQVIFQATAVQNSENSTDEEASLQKRLNSHLANKQFVTILLEKMSCLHTDITQFASFQSWLQDRFKATLAASIQEAFDKLLPDVNTEELNIDITEKEIWFSEVDSGGMGIITAIAAEMQNASAKFETLFHQAVSYCPREDIASGLTEVLEHLGEPKLQDLFQQIRTQDAIDQQKQSLQDLQKYLSEIGITPKRELVISIVNKMLHGNSSFQTDELMSYLQSAWKREEERLQCRIDTRIFSVASLRLGEVEPMVQDILEQLQPGMPIDEKQRFALVDSMLWSGCKDSCPECLSLYSTYQPFAKPSRLLLQSYMRPVYYEVSVEEHEWMEQAYSLLKEGKQVRVISPFQRMADCQYELIRFIQTPIDFQFEMYYPFISRVTNKGAIWYFDLSVREINHV